MITHARIAELLIAIAGDLDSHADTARVADTTLAVDLRKLAIDLGTLVGEIVAPVPMLLWCPGCGERHLDVGEFATKPHHTHACQSCGMVWRPAIGPTCGVQFLPGFKNPTPVGEPTIHVASARCPVWKYPGHDAWDCRMNKPGGLQCAHDINHTGDHEPTGPWNP